MENIKTGIDFQTLFEAAPGLFLVLKPNTPDFTIVAVSEAYLQATKTKRKDIIGHGLFEIFPDNPDDINADGVSNLKKSLDSVLANKKMHKMAIQKYDIQRPQSEGGGFEERHWSPLNSPVLNKKNEVEYIIHRVEDITEFAVMKQKAKEETDATRIELDKKSLFIKNNQERINGILDVLLKYTVMDFSEKIPITVNADELDAIAVGLNTLSEELQSHTLLLKESEERYHNMVEEVEDYAILLLDKNGFIQNWNKGVKKIKGYDIDEILGKNFNMFYPSEARESKLPEKLLEKAVRKGKAIEEGWRIKKDGTFFWAYVVLTALHDEKNNVIGFSKVTRDLTLLKEAEDKLIAVNKELEAFSYSVSHDLRAPLRAIDGYAKILEEDYGKMLDGEGNRLLETVQFNAKKMGNLIDDLLAFSRLGKKELTKTDLNMNELVEGALYELNKSVKHQAKVEIKHLHPAKGDYGLINQVVVNLLSNALKYSSKVKEPLIEIGSEKKGDKIIYSVKDNGAGFDMRYVNKLFGVFQRLHTMDEFEGTGVGLAIVQRILAKHGGDVSAEGEKNKGAIFKFSLPLK
ncbi:MAG TPA: PAS domain S-box protein [Bacteroidia bacterium]|jgi:PAS domain S-box-containing protein|nr:PAS domain S-box protein [Bacteroidia bacterium]